MTTNSWQLAAEDYHGQLRYRGQLSCAQPMAFLIKVYDAGGGYGYSKTPKSAAGEHEIDWLLHGWPGARRQVLLRLGHTVNSTISWPPGDIEVFTRGTFQEGAAFELARFGNGRAAIGVLGIACSKLESVRCGRWRAKTRYLDAIGEDHPHILVRTRHGYVPGRAEPAT